MKFSTSLIAVSATLLASFASANPVPSLEKRSVIDLVSSPVEFAEDVVGWVSEKSSAGDGKMRAAASWTYHDCGEASDVIQLKSLTVSPDPPVPGQKLSVTAVADVKEEVHEGAVADVVVKLGLVKLLTKRFDICEEAANANATVQCPIAPGPYDVTQTVDLPSQIPKAKFTVNVQGFNYDDKPLLCANIIIDFMNRN